MFECFSYLHRFFFCPLNIGIFTYFLMYLWQLLHIIKTCTASVPKNVAYWNMCSWTIVALREQQREVCDQTGVWEWCQVWTSPVYNLRIFVMDAPFCTLFISAALSITGHVESKCFWRFVKDVLFQLYNLKSCSYAPKALMILRELINAWPSHDCFYYVRYNFCLVPRLLL